MSGFPSGNGLIASGWGMSASGRRMIASSHRMTDSSHRMTGSSVGMIGCNRGMTGSNRGMTASNRGMIGSNRGMTGSSLAGSDHLVAGNNTRLPGARLVADGSHKMAAGGGRRTSGKSCFGSGSRLFAFGRCPGAGGAHLRRAGSTKSLVHLDKTTINMARIICFIILLISCNDCFAQDAKPWEWDKDQNKYALYDGGAGPRRPLALIVNPQAYDEPIYAHDEKGYAAYVAYVAFSYGERYGLNAEQYKSLYEALLQHYNKWGTNAKYVHQAVDYALRQWLNGEQRARWQQLKIYPEYDPYYLERGRGWDVYNK